VNVKELEFMTDTAAILVKRIKPDFKKLGPKFGKLMKQIAEAVTGLSREDIALLEKEGKFLLQMDGQTVEITTADVEIISEDIPGWQVANMGSLTVALDITITPGLWEEGIARELINRIQNLRKDKGFDVTDKIEVEIEKQDEIDSAIRNNFAYISSETLAVSLTIKDKITTPDADTVELTDSMITRVSILKSNKE